MVLWHSKKIRKGRQTPIWLPQGSKFAGRYGFRQPERVSTQEVEVQVGERRGSGDIGGIDVPTFPRNLVNHCLHEEAVPVCNCVESESENADLLFLPLAAKADSPGRRFF